MATIANLNVILNLEDNAFQRGLQNSRDKLDSWGSSLRNIGTKITAGVTAPLVLAGGAMVNWASDLDESINKVNVLFDGAAGTVLDFSETTATGLGMSQQAALDFSSSFAGMLKPVAANSDELANMSTKMTQLVGDFASFHNLNPEEAFTVLSSAMAGETEAIRKYGVDVSAAAVEQKAMEMGLAATSGELTEQDKLLARYAIIMDETTDAQGDFNRTQDSTSNKMKAFKARVQDLGASFGRLLLPYVNKVLDVFSDLMDWLGKLDGGTRKWILGIAALAAAMGPVLLVIGMLLPGLSALLGLFGAILSPIGLVVAALVALAAVFRDDIIDAVQTAVEWFTEFVTSSENVQDMVGNLVDAFNAFKAGDFGEAFAAVGRAAGNLWGAIQEAVAQIDWGTIGQSLLDGLASLASFVAGFVLNLGSIAVSVAGWLWNQVVDLWDGLVSWAVGLVPAGESVNIGTVAAAIAGWAFNAARDLWDALTSWAVGGSYGDGTGGATADKVGKVSLGEIVANIASWSFTSMIDLWTTLRDWVLAQVSGKDWSAIGTEVGNSIRNAIRDGIQNAADLFAILLSWVSDQIRGVDWNSVGATFAEWLITGIKGIVGLVGLAGWLLGQVLLAIVEVDWSAVGSAFKTFFVSAITALVGFLTGFATTLYNELVTEIGEINWSEIGSTIKTALVDAMKGIGTAMWNAVMEEFSGAGSGSTTTEPPDDIGPWNPFPDGGSQDKPTGTDLIPEGGLPGGFAGGKIAQIFRDITSAAADAALAIPPVTYALASVGGTVPIIGSVGTTAQSSFGMAGSAAGALASTSTASFSTIASSAGSNFGAMAGSAVSNFGTTRSTGMSETASLSASVGSSIASMVSRAGGDLGRMASQAISHFGSMRNNAQSAGAGIAAAISTGTSNAANAAGQQLGRIPGIVSGVGATAAGNAYSAGANISNSMASGMESALARIRAAGAAMAQAADDAVSALLKISSPSRVFMALGAYVGEGFALGIEGSSREVARASEAMVHIPEGRIPGLPQLGDDGVAGGVHNHYYYSVTPDDLRRLIEDAKAGGSFARNFGGELAMMGGQG